MRIFIPKFRTIKRFSLWGIGMSTVYYFATIDSTPMPGYHFLSEDNDYTDKIKQSGKDNYYHNKYGSKYGNYLVGITTLQGGDDKNDNWWEWLFINRYQPWQDDIEDKFSKKLENKEAVKAKCLEAYKATSGNGNSQIKTTEEEAKGNFLERNIWLFCSPYGAKPESIKSDEKYDGQMDSYRKVLISTASYTYSNNMFWDLKQKEFSKDKDFSKEDKKVRKWCEYAYKQKTIPTSNGSQITENNIFKWCSLEGKKPNE